MMVHLLRLLLLPLGMQLHPRHLLRQVQADGNHLQHSQMIQMRFLGHLLQIARRQMFLHLPSTMLHGSRPSRTQLLSSQPPTRSQTNQLVWLLEQVRVTHVWQTICR